MPGSVHAGVVLYAACLLTACAGAATIGGRGGVATAASPTTGAVAPTLPDKRTAGLPRVAGWLETTDGRALTSGAVVIAREGGETAERASTGVQDVTILPDGSFVFLDVPPGEYVIRARGDVDPNSVTRFASFRVRVEAGADVEGIHLRLEPGALVEGRVMVARRQGARGPAWDSVRVRAPFADGTAFGERLDGQVRRDGTFSIRGIMAGTHILAVEGLPGPWVLQQVTLRGRDITKAGFIAERNGRYTDVRIAITDAPAANPEADAPFRHVQPPR